MSGLQFAAPKPPRTPKPALLLVFALASCVGQRAAVVTPGGSPAAVGNVAEPGRASPSPPSPPSPSPSPPPVFRGMCDASGAVTLGETLFAVADDEDNVLRVYDSRRGGDPLHEVDVSPAMELPAKKRPPELDIEAATRLGKNAYWLTSHGRDRKGKRHVARFRFFATSTSDDGSGIAPIGRPYNRLLDDLIDAPQLARFGLAEAAQRPPKETGGLNIEGMTGRPDGQSILIGFRNPLPMGRALVVPLLNPAALFEGAAADFGAPKLLDLGGLGIRGLSLWRGRYLIIGGDIASGAPSRLFVWDGDTDKPTAVPVDWGDLNPEAFVSYPASAEVLMLSDDGSVVIDGTECKRLEDPRRKQFRGVWIRLP